MFGLKMKKGQSLIEVVIALGVVVALSVAIVSTSLFTQSASNSAKNSTQATKLVEQNIEQLRVLRDRRGFSFLTSGAGCKKLDVPNVNDPSGWSISSAAPCPETLTPEKTTFSRSLTISDDSANRKTVKVTVTWVEPKGLLKVENTTKLSNCVSGSVGC